MKICLNHGSLGGIQSSMKRRDKIYKKSIKAILDIKQEYASQYIKHSEIKLSNYVETVSPYISKLFSRSNVSIIKYIWKGINKIINISNKNRNVPSSLIENNKLISEPG